MITLHTFVRALFAISLSRHLYFECSVDSLAGKRPSSRLRCSAYLTASREVQALRVYCSLIISSLKQRFEVPMYSEHLHDSIDKKQGVNEQRVNLPTGVQLSGSVRCASELCTRERIRAASEMRIACETNCSRMYGGEQQVHQ